MDQRKLLTFLQSSKLVSPKAATAIASAFTRKEWPKHYFFLEEGKISNHYLFLESGFMRAFAVDLHGNDITTHFYASNQVVFEVSSFFNRTASKENIQATEDCIGWYITYDALNNLFHNMPEFREFGRSILVRGFAELKTRMLSMITETAEQRYDALLKSNPEIFQRAALKHIATYLGVTDTSLSRIRKEYSKQKD